MSGQRQATPGSRTYCEIAAYHEAGHAVAALLLGIRIVEVRIDHRRPGAGQTVYLVTHPPLERPREPWTIAPSRWARSLSREQRRAVFALAGPLAEARLLGKPMRTLGSIGDLESVHQLMRWPETQGGGQPHGAVRPEAKLFFEAEIRRTRRILNRPPVWHAVTVIAGDLLTWGRLRSDDVAGTVQWAMGGCRQISLFTGTNNMSGTAVPQKHEDQAPASLANMQKTGSNFFPMTNAGHLATDRT